MQMHEFYTNPRRLGGELAVDIYTSVHNIKLAFIVIYWLLSSTLLGYHVTDVAAFT